MLMLPKADFSSGTPMFRAQSFGRVSAKMGCEEASVKIKIFFGRKLVKGLIFIMPRLRERLLYL